MNHLRWWVVKRHCCVVENIRNGLARIQWRSSSIYYIISIFTNDRADALKFLHRKYALENVVRPSC